VGGESDDGQPAVGNAQHQFGLEHALEIDAVGYPFSAGQLLIGWRQRPAGSTHGPHRHIGCPSCPQDRRRRSDRYDLSMRAPRATGHRCENRVNRGGRPLHAATVSPSRMGSWRNKKPATFRAGESRGGISPPRAPRIVREPQAVLT
jgi:hypothetical protein